MIVLTLTPKVHRIHARVIPYSDFRFGASSSAKRLYAAVVSFPIPPAVENTSGVNTAYSNSLILPPYYLFFAISCCQDIGTSVARCVRVKNPNIYASCCRLQNPFDLISNLALSCLLTVRGSMISPESDCSCGSFSTSVHTSVSHWAVTSLISLCLAIGSPP